MSDPVNWKAVLRQQEEPEPELDLTTVSVMEKAAMEVSLSLKRIVFRLTELETQIGRLNATLEAILRKEAPPAKTLNLIL